MPKLDKTGPSGEGPKTGRGLGKCKPTFKSTKTEKRGIGMGLRRQAPK